MYIVIAGKHPLYESGDNQATYLEKLQTPHWSCPEHFSTLAQSLFYKLVKVNPLERYTAKEALCHPWITRQPGPIPLSFTENVAYENSKTALVKTFVACFFLGRVATLGPHLSDEYDDKVWTLNESHTF